jgi:hypothetical protein
MVYTVCRVRNKLGGRYMDWAEFFQILADFIMQLVAFFKSSEEGTTKTTD